MVRDNKDVMGGGGGVQLLVVSLGPGLQSEMLNLSPLYCWHTALIFRLSPFSCLVIDLIKISDLLLSFNQ